jgi:hypothetical protein
MSVELECPECSGRGCKNCDDGYWELRECPGKFIGQQFHKAKQFADLAKRGILPVAGGAMDQTQWFLDFCQFYWSESAYWRAKLGLTVG